MGRTDWNLLVLASADGEPLSPVQIQKALFLLSRKLPTDVLGGVLYDFKPDAYGPFDPVVYHDAETMSAEGLTRISTSRGGVTEYAATLKGQDRARELSAGLDSKVAEYVRQVVAWVRSQSFSSLLRAIYDQYPEMAEKAVFRTSSSRLS